MSFLVQLPLIIRKTNLLKKIIKRWTSTKLKIGLEKVHELKTKMGEQFNEQMRIATQIFIPQLTYEHYTPLVLDIEKRNFYFFNSDIKVLQEGKTNIHNKNAYAVISHKLL